MVADKAAGIVVAIHACDEGGTRRDGVFSVVALGTRPFLSQDDKKLAINFDDDFEGGFQF